MPTKSESYANALYAEFVETAQERVIGEYTVTTWTGFLIATCRKVGIPVGTESRVIKPLEEMGCIQVLQRGVSNHPSVIVLIKAPTEELWESPPKALTRAPSLATLMAEVENVKRQIGGVNIPNALKDHEDRLRSLEQQRQKGHNGKSTKK